LSQNRKHGGGGGVTPGPRWYPQKKSQVFWADLAVLSAVLSSLKNKAIARDLIIFGEVGLTGEIRPVQGGEERISDAAKHGFKHAIIPTANAPRKPIKGIKVTTVQHLSEAIEALK
jgi:DNA repair protein RadA/Sms